MKTAALLFFGLILANMAFAGGTFPPATCGNSSDQTVSVTRNVKEFVIQTAFTYVLFDGLYKQLYPQLRHVPGDEHSAEIFASVPLTSCSETEGSINCRPEPSETLFTTDILSQSEKIEVSEINVTNNPAGFDLRLKLQRGEHTADGQLHFSPTDCQVNP